MRLRRPLIRLAWPALLPILLAAGLLLANPAPADAATITGTGTGDSLANDQICTLIEAIINANHDSIMHGDCLVAGSGADTIRFQIPTFSDFGCNPSTRVCTIVTSASYSINGPLTIDGYTQTNTSPNTLEVGNNAVIRIRLLAAHSNIDTALRITANDVTIRGLVIGGYAQYGIRVEQGVRMRIIGCFIGTDPTGTQASPNPLGGIRVVSAASGTVVGGTGPADRNLISGHTVNDIGVGIYLERTTGVTIQGNYIGVKANGVEALRNVFGILAADPVSVTIGGTTSAARNVISGSLVSGIQLNAPSQAVATGHVVQGNYIGVRADRAGFIPNHIGVEISSPGNTIGGTAAGAGNVIAGNFRANVQGSTSALMRSRGESLARRQAVYQRPVWETGGQKSRDARSPDGRR